MLIYILWIKLKRGITTNLLYEEEIALFECSIIILDYSKMLNLERMCYVLKENTTEYSRMPLKLYGKPLEANAATRSVHYRVHFVTIVFKFLITLPRRAREINIFIDINPSSLEIIRFILIELKSFLLIILSYNYLRSIITFLISLINLGLINFLSIEYIIIK